MRMPGRPHWGDCFEEGQNRHISATV